MLTSAPSLPVPVMLWALLLMPASLGAQHATWDNASCTEGKVFVLRGERAVMACNISNSFSRITVWLVGPGKALQTIFNNVAPGNHSKDRWKLLVQEGTAQLVTEEAQGSQAGQYQWLLEGHQKKFLFTALSISAEPQGLPSQGPEMLFSRPKAISQPQSQVPISIIISIIVVIFVILLILGFRGVSWLRRPRFARPQKLLQGSEL